MDPKRSGLYRRYELMVAQLLDRQGMTVDQLLADRIDPARRCWRPCVRSPAIKRNIRGRTRSKLAGGCSIESASP